MLPNARVRAALVSPPAATPLPGLLGAQAAAALLLHLEMWELWGTVLGTIIGLKTENARNRLSGKIKTFIRH